MNARNPASFVDSIIISRASKPPENTNISGSEPENMPGVGVRARNKYRVGPRPICIEHVDDRTNGRRRIVKSHFVHVKPSANELHSSLTPSRIQLAFAS